jgi:hypothetical protein
MYNCILAFQNPLGTQEEQTYQPIWWQNSSCYGHPQSDVATEMKKGAYRDSNKWWIQIVKNSSNHPKTCTKILCSTNAIYLFLCVVKHLLQMFTVHCKSVSETRTCLNGHARSQACPSIHPHLSLESTSTVCLLYHLSIQVVSNGEILLRTRPAQNHQYDIKD